MAARYGVGLGSLGAVLHRLTAIDNVPPGPFSFHYCSQSLVIASQFALICQRIGKLPDGRQTGGCTNDELGPSIEFRNSLVPARNADPEIRHASRTQ